MSPKRQQVLTVLKRVSCLKCPKKASCPKLSPAKGNKSSLSQNEYLVPNAQKKHLVQNVLIVPRKRQTTTWSASSATSRSPSTSPPSTCTPPASPWRFFQLNRIKHCPWPMLMLLSLPQSPLSSNEPQNLQIFTTSSHHPLLSLL